MVPGMVGRLVKTGWASVAYDPPQKRRRQDWDLYRMAMGGLFASTRPCKSEMSGSRYGRTERLAAVIFQAGCASLRY